ncbi:MAG: antitoxin MazE family protein [Sulfobacillus sp.]
MQPVRKRVAGHRQRLRAPGLRPLQIWVPDTRRPGFPEECRRQSLSLRADPSEPAVLEFMAEIADWTGH